MLKIRRVLLLAVCAWGLAITAGHAQQEGVVLQSGLITPGHPAIWITNGVIGDGGPALSGNLTELGITNTGTPSCINDGPITGPYHQLCFGANALGGGLISYNAYDGAPPLPLQCDINGVLQPCLSSNAVGTPLVGVGTPLVVAGSPKCDNSTDDTAAINARLASGASKTYVGPSGKICFSATGILIPNGVVLNWEDFSTNGTQASGLRCGPLVANCVTVGGGNNGYAALNNIAIFGATVGNCVLFNGNNNIQAENVYCQNFADGFVSGGDGVATGIYLHGTNLYTCQMHDADMIVNQAPGEYFTNPILGCDGAFDVPHADYVRIVGNWDNVKGTLHFVDPHFNLGQNRATCAFNFKSFTGSTNQFVDFVVTGGHIEAVNNFLCSDASVASIAQMVIQGNTSVGNFASTHFFALNPATEPEYWSFTGNQAFAWNDYTLAPNAGPSAIQITGNTFPGLLHVTANIGGDAVITDNNYIGGATLDGSGWLTGQFNGVFLGGSSTFSNSALQNINITLNSVNCTVALQIGGSSTGITYSAGTPACTATLSDHYLSVSFELSVTSSGGLSGALTMTGLPFQTLGFFAPSMPVTYGNLAGLSGAPTSEVSVSAHTVQFVMPGPANPVALTQANLGTCSTGTPCVIEGVVTYLVAGN